VRVVYSDESGLGGLEAEPLTVVTAICINVDEHWDAIERELTDVIYAIPSRKLLAKGSELKGRKLFKSLRRRIPGAEEALKATLSVAIRQKVPIFFAAIDRQGFRRFRQQPILLKSATPRNAEETAFSECVRRVEQHVSAFLPKERVLWISDHGSHEPSFQAGLTRTKVNEEAWLPYSGKNVASHIVDTVYFGHSDHSLALQLADVCCSTISLWLLEKWYGWPVLATPFYEMIETQIAFGMGRPYWCTRGEKERNV
jgi:hypothetical protein